MPAEVKLKFAQKKRSLSLWKKECGQATMLRTRMVAFATGFAVTGAAIAHFVWKDLCADSLSLSSNVKSPLFFFFGFHRGWNKGGCFACFLSSCSYVVVLVVR